MGFKEVTTAESGLRLPINGKQYLIPPVDAELGPRLQALVSLGVTAHVGGDPQPADVELLDDLEERELYPRVLSPAVYEQMHEDGVPWTWIKHAALTVMIDTTIDRATAEAFWAAGPERVGKARPRRPQDRRKGTDQPTGTGSTAGTTPNRAQRRARSRGRGSSSTGN